MMARPVKAMGMTFSLFYLIADEEKKKGESLIKAETAMTAEHPPKRVFLLTFSNGTRSFLNNEEMNRDFPFDFARLNLKE